MADEQQDAEPIVREVPEQHRYAITLDGETAGFTEYVDHGGRRIFVHTEIDERFAGRGLASTLISQALTGTRSAGLRVVPICPFVAKYVKKHNDFDDIVDAVTPSAIAAVRAAKG